MVILHLPLRGCEPLTVAMSIQPNSPRETRLQVAMVFHRVIPLVTNHLTHSIILFASLCSAVARSHYNNLDKPRSAEVSFG